MKRSAASLAKGCSLRTSVPRAGAGLLLLLLLASCDGSARKSPRALVVEIRASDGEPLGLAFLLQEAAFDTESARLSDDLDLAEIDLLALGSFISDEPSYAEFVQRNSVAILEFVRRGGVLLQMSQSPENEVVLLPEELPAKRLDGSRIQSFIRDEGHRLVRHLPTMSQGGMRSLELPKMRQLDPIRFPLNFSANGRQIVMADRGGESTALHEVQLGNGRMLRCAFWFDRSVDGKGVAIDDPLLAAAAGTFFRNLRGYVLALRAGKLKAVPNSPPFPIPQPATFVPGSWTLVVLPDTQYYARDHPDIFLAQTQWIADQTLERNIRYVLHVGDITNDNTHPQWQLAQDAMAKLHGNVGYALTTGNHDVGPGGQAGSRRTLFDEYFPLSELTANAGLLESLDTGANAVHGFQANGESWIVLSLEWGPRSQTLQWGASMLKKYKRSRAIVLTHAYLVDGDVRQNFRLHPTDKFNPHSYLTAAMRGGSNDGEEIWQRLVSKYSNVDFVLGGHSSGDGIGRLSSTHGNGHVVHQLLANYQNYDLGGGGYLRLIEFLPEGKTIQVLTYSPYLDRYYTDWENQFMLELSPRSRRPS